MFVFLGRLDATSRGDRVAGMEQQGWKTDQQTKVLGVGKQTGPDQ